MPGNAFAAAGSGGKSGHFGVSVLSVAVVFIAGSRLSRLAC